MRLYVEGHRAMSPTEDTAGTYAARCTCGWESVPVGNEDATIELLMLYAYEVGLAAQSKVGGDDAR